MSSLPIPQIWIPRREWFCPTCGKPRLAPTRKRRSLLRKFLGPMAWFASGDVMLDSSGNVILDSSGNVLLDDGSGNSCCCGPTPVCWCNSPTNTINYKSHVTLTLSGVNPTTGVCHKQLGINGPTYTVDSYNLNKTWTLTYVGNVGNPNGCSYSATDTSGATASFTVYSGANCTGSTSTATGIVLGVGLNAAAAQPFSNVVITVYPIFGNAGNCDMFFTAGSIASPSVYTLTCGGTILSIPNEVNAYGSSFTSCLTNYGGTATLTDGP